MASARGGDLDAYEVLVVRYSPLAHRTAVLFGAGDDAPDVVQEAFVKAFRSLRRFREGAAFRPWLLQIVVNETRNLHRSRSRRATLAARVVALGGSGPAEVSGADVEALAHERRAALLAAVQALPERDRAVVTCRYLLELSESETARALGWPAGTVKSQLSRALDRLQAMLAGDSAESGRSGGPRADRERR